MLICDSRTVGRHVTDVTQLRIGQSLLGTEHSSRYTHLQVHVSIRADQITLVLQPPLESHPDLLARKILEEWFWVDRLNLGSTRLSADAPGNRPRETYSRHIELIWLE